MLAIFFPHMFEDVEYLLPEDEIDPMQGSEAPQASTSQGAGPASASAQSHGSLARWAPQENAIAGPSRSR